MKKITKSNGFTLVEMIFALTITGFIGLGALAMTVTALRCQDNSSTQTFTDTDAVYCMQKIVADVREAKSFVVVNSSNLQLTFPVRVGNYYDRHTPDLNNVVNWYLSDATGSQTKTGPYLWWAKNGAPMGWIKKDVSSLAYIADPAAPTAAVEITISIQNTVSRGTKQTNLTTRVVYLRNS